MMPPSNRSARCMASGLAIVAIVGASGAGTGLSVAPQRIVVSTTAEFRAALSRAVPGTVIALSPGVYRGGSFHAGLAGEPNAPITVEAVDSARPPVIAGGNNGIQLSDARYVTFRNLIFERAEQNGINIDDAETYDTPSHHIVLTRVTVRDIRSGNRDGIKLSGVTDFVIEDSAIERWGDSGSAIDMVGCHRGLIRNNVFRHTPGLTVGNGVQAKGGTSQVTITGNRFEHAAARAVQIGGVTTLRFFRPQPPDRAEATDIRVERNVFVGGETAVAFVGSEGGTFRFNTVYLPTKHLLRILQEHRAPDLLRSRNGVFTDNIVYWSGDLVVNVGDMTDPATFTFARNWWYRRDVPRASRPALPSIETRGVYGADPQFRAPPADFRALAAGGRGAHAGGSGAAP